MNQTADPVKPGHIKWVRLAEEGRLSRGDFVETVELGVCEVALVVDASTISVRAADGFYHRVSGIGLPGAKVVERNADGCEFDASEDVPDLAPGERVR